MQKLFFRHLAQTSNNPMALEISHAQGIYLFTPKGARVIDLVSGVGVSNVGHSHPKIIHAVQEQVQKHMHVMVYGEYIQCAQIQLAEAVCRLLPKNLSNVYFVNSGSEAIEGAMKLAKRYTQRSEIVAFKNAYHGSTQGALSIVGSEDFKQNFRPLLPSIRTLTFNAIEDLQQITERTACVVVEPIQAEAGVRIPQKDFLPQLAARCKEVGALLVLDEVQTGIGRTGTMFAFERYNICPDILVLGKAFGGGMPLGAFIASKSIMNSLANPPLGHIT
ncbi:MAG: aspartate aminotransferase family protein, partial [Bacteroidales bacterium]